MLARSASVFNSASKGLNLQHLTGLYSGFGFFLGKVRFLSILLEMSFSSFEILAVFCLTELESFWTASVFCLTELLVEASESADFESVFEPVLGIL